MKKIYTPLIEKTISSLQAGDELVLDGVIYTARDLAHQEMIGALRRGKLLPVSLRNQVIYYCGPNPARKNRVIGSCGPTTSARMDDFTVDLLKDGLKGMIGKGARSAEVREAIKKYQAVYFVTIGGAGALLAAKVKKARVVAYKQLGPEAIYKLEVRDFPLIVAIDARGRDIYEK
ncbi:MAG: FumA C-terminus/TtdB family hydratase beta subunit [Candidatus Omnitrophota bacterium]